MKKLVKGKYVEFTAEEIVATKRDAIQHTIQERTRPLTAEEVTAKLITAQINTLTVDDNTALRMREFYPAWTVGDEYAVGFKVQYEGRLWKCLTEHTAIDTWQPSTATASVWTEICETHSGTEDDPIPYNGNMALESGKYYVQDWVIYLCNRDSEIPVYHALADLVGSYVVAI